MELVTNKGNDWIVKIHVQVKGFDVDEVFEKCEDLEKVINKQKDIKVML